jgi:hypothetical protein
MVFGLPELLIKPGCGRASDRHDNSDSQARTTLKIIPNNPDVHPTGHHQWPKMSEVETIIVLRLMNCLNRPLEVRTGAGSCHGP